MQQNSLRGILQQYDVTSGNKKNLKQPKPTPKVTREEQTQPKVNRKKEIIKIRTEINEIEMKETTEQINETGNWFLEKINKIHKPLARLIKKKRERV